MLRQFEAVPRRFITRRHEATQHQSGGQGAERTARGVYRAEETQFIKPDSRWGRDCLLALLIIILR